MSIMKGSFGSVKFNWVVGYRISACYAPKQGFQGLFFVYVWDRNDPTTPFAQGVDVGADGRPTRGRLELADDERNYSFDQIDLESVQVGSTRRERYRLFEFRYTSNETSAQKTPTSFSNNSDVELKKNALGDDYKFSLGGSAQHLLGFRTRLAASKGSVVRFTSLRGRQNSFVETIVAANDQNAAGKAMNPFTVNFSQGPLNVTQENLTRAYVDESYGELCRVSPTSLLDVTGDQAVEEAVRMRMDDFSQSELLEHDAKHNTQSGFLKDETIQSATFVFKAGQYQDLRIT